jgi:hypothetical protein
MPSLLAAWQEDLYNCHPAVGGVHATSKGVWLRWGGAIPGDLLILETDAIP